jgi:hypothetical protein
MNEASIQYHSHTEAILHDVFTDVKISIFWTRHGPLRLKLSFKRMEIEPSNLSRPSIGYIRDMLLFPPTFQDTKQKALTKTPTVVVSFTNMVIHNRAN